MTTRRQFLTLAGASAATLAWGAGAATTLAGCTLPAGRSAAPAAPPGAPDVVLVEAGPGGLVIVRRDAVQRLGAAVATPDGATAFLAQPRGRDTDLLTVTTGTGEITGTTPLTGAWVPSVAGGRGGCVAMVEPGRGAAATGAGYLPAGTGRTSVLLVRPGNGFSQLDLAGNYVPDAFTLDAGALYVLDWLPASAPQYYRVREIDVSTGQASPLLGRDKAPVPPDDEEQMRGQRRDAVFAPDRSVLYSLYTNQPGVGPAEPEHGWSPDDTAFIHTLQLDQHWAYCVDLPAPFGLSPNANHAIAISRDGGQLFVVDTAGGRVALVDTNTLAVTRVVAFAGANGAAIAANGAAFATFAADALHVGAGNQVLVLDRASLAVRATWPVSAPVRGLASSVDGSRVYVGTAGRLDWHTAATGTHLGGCAVAGLTGIRTVY